MGRSHFPNKILVRTFQFRSSSFDKRGTVRVCSMYVWSQKCRKEFKSDKCMMDGIFLPWACVLFHCLLYRLENTKC